MPRKSKKDKVIDAEFEAQIPEEGSITFGGESTAEIVVDAEVMRPQPHGGALRRGRPPGKGRFGPAPDELRDEFRRMLWDDVLPTLQKVLKEGFVCAVCKRKHRTKMRPEDLKGLADMLAKYGIGTKIDVGAGEGSQAVGIVILPALPAGGAGHGEDNS